MGHLLIRPCREGPRGEAAFCHVCGLSPPWPQKALVAPTGGGDCASWPGCSWGRAGAVWAWPGQWEGEGPREVLGARGRHPSTRPSRDLCSRHLLLPVFKITFQQRQDRGGSPALQSRKTLQVGHSLLSLSPARAAVSPPELPPRSHLPVRSHRREAGASGSAFHSAPSDPQTLRPPGEKPRTQQPRLPGRGPPRQPAAGRSHGSAPRGHFLCGLGVRGGPLSFPFLVPPCGVCPMPRSFSGPSNTPSHDAPPPSVWGGGVCRHLLAAGSRCCCKHLGPSCG